jgi:ATP-dependent helicase/nuclease subunit A
VVYDWSTNSYGLSTGPHQTLGYLRVQEKQVERERAERRRVFYVGMTRAKELLLLSGGLTSRSVGETVLEWLGDIGEGDIGNSLTQRVRIGSSEIAHRVVAAPDRKWPRRTSTTAETGPAIHAPSIARLWDDRTARWDTTRARLWHLTPSSMRESDSIGGDKLAGGSVGREIGQLVGVIAHRILERWDFSSPPEALLGEIAAFLDTFVSAENESVRAKVEDSLREIFTTFGGSESYARLRSADILGREVPFLMPWNGDQVMEGVVDVIYRLDGKMSIADYKTDRVTGSEVTAKAGLYADQAAIYREAATRCLGLSEVSFQLLFLRAGVSVDL